MFWWILSACSTFISVEDFDRSCAQPEDCVVRVEGELCGFSCPTEVAISASDAERYDRTQQRRRKNCRAHGFIGCDLLLPEATCDQGLCVVVPEDVP